MRSHIGSPDRYARLDSSPSAMENGGLVNGGLKGAAAAATSVAVRNLPGRRTAHNMSSSSLRKKSELTLVSKIRCRCLRDVVSNLQEVILGTKLSVLFLAIPLAITAQAYDYGKPWIFGLSLLGLTPLAERVSFLTEQIAYYTGPTVGGLLNATCGNATELIIAVLALSKNKISVVKYTLLGSILSNLLLVLGTSLFCGGIVNLNQEQKFDSRQADANVLLLLLGLSCHLLPLLLASSSTALVTSGVVSEPSISTLGLSRVSSIVMLVAYFAFLVFQLWTHRQLFEAEEDSDEVISTGAGGVGGGSSKDESHVIGFWSGFTWLVGMTIVIALLSEYVVATIEDASESWGLSIAFISVIMLPIVGNAAEHAGAIIFAFKNKLDITLGVALGSATQISMFVVPMCVVVSWVMGLKMDLKFSGFETGCLALSIVITAVALQDGSAHYMKGLVLLLCYIIIGACFFVLKPPLPPSGVDNVADASISASAQR